MISRIPSSTPPGRLPAVGGDAQMDIPVAGMAEGVDLHAIGGVVFGQARDELGDPSQGDDDVLMDVQGVTLLDPERYGLADLPHPVPPGRVGGHQDVRARLLPGRSLRSPRSPAESSPDAPSASISSIAPASLTPGRGGGRRPAPGSGNP